MKKYRKKHPHKRRVRPYRDRKIEMKDYYYQKKKEKNMLAKK